MKLCSRCSILKHVRATHWYFVRGGEVHGRVYLCKRHMAEVDKRLVGVSGLVAEMEMSQPLHSFSAAQVGENE